jgi:hypothetical protein
MARVINRARCGGEIRALYSISMRVFDGWLDLEQTMYRESSLSPAI